MSYSIEVTAYFAKQLKRLIKKYPSLKKEFADMVHSLKDNPEQGTKVGNHCYKIRLAISSKNKGKSGVARVITHVQIVKKKVFLLSIYDKSEQSDVQDKDLADWIKNL
jgi:mRNA-degrading endonuclease RelE of RelBE toxin-antitoxin system